MRYGCVLLVAIFGVSPAWAQQAISARSGMIHYVEGDVAINGGAIHPKFAEFPEIKNGELLSTHDGRAEVLLTPGVFLRLAENSSVRMLSNSLADTRLEMVSGSALIEAGELLPDNTITFEMDGARIGIPKRGLYRIDAAEHRLSVFDGQALISSDAGKMRAKKGQLVALDSGALSPSKFDVKNTDPFYRWSGRRAQYIAAANVASARVAANSDYRSSFGGGASAWNWNPWFGMYTYVPASGIYWSPFGPAFYSPRMMGNVYLPRRPMWGYGGGPQDGYARNPGGPGGMPPSAPTMSMPPMRRGPPSMGGPGSGGGFPGGAPSPGGRGGGFPGGRGGN